MRLLPGSMSLSLGLTLAMAGCSGGDSESSRAQAQNETEVTATTPTEPARSVPEELRSAKVIFAREDGIYVGRADGKAIRRIFDLPRAFEYQPDVAPDGSRVAIRVDGGPRTGGTWLIDIDGSHPVHVTKTAGVVGSMADWSPDGESFVFAGKRTNETHFGLWIVAADGSTARRITSDDWEAQYPAWSPDGELIAFTRVVPSTNGFSLYLVQPDGNGLRRLSEGAAADNYAAWSPTSRELVFHSERPDGAGLWIVSRDGPGERFLGEGGEPQWEPREWIIFDCPTTGDKGKACVIRADGSGYSELPLGEEAVFANWVP
jgi:Tol biopolymer transport system component